MNTNPIPEKLKERFRQLVKDKYEFDDQESEDKLLEIIYQACQLAQGEKWISVDDRLPEFGEKVLICRYNDNILMGRLHVDSKTESPVWCAFFIDKFDIANGVTHWRPLPTPPVK